MRKYRLRWNNVALTQRVVKLLCEPQVTSAEGAWEGGVWGGRMTQGVVRGQGFQPRVGVGEAGSQMGWPWLLGEPGTRRAVSREA